MGGTLRFRRGRSCGTVSRVPARVRKLIEPKRDQILRFCAEDPVERVFLEDVARRGLGRFVARAHAGELSALCHLGINAVPSGQGCGVFARDVARSGPRMLIGEARAVSELWDEAQSRLPKPREDRPGQPVFVIRQAPAGRRHGSARRATRRSRAAHACVRGRPRAGARGRSDEARSRRLPLAHARARSRTSARGSGSRTA